ncbi:hypothetical protein BDY19DRAFT_906234 [Irpex rosettiformis]|uniref:Uncharacterized protein n=1 Tax=Irpex rosettiformis TaxID=378272 RepID=A0ACB8U5W1_9APHY|nr:hypothetical protein BDY19DRAFT_906234 [Irpex rosettiformis]
MSSGQEDNFNPSLIYRLFFLYIEPISALAGAFYAAVLPQTYLDLLSSNAHVATHTSSIAAIDTPTLASLYQLANLYLLFALNEHFVLSHSTSLRTWRALLFGLLIADFGHLATMIPVALVKEGGYDGLVKTFINFWTWNAMEWGSVGFVYVGAGMRISFLVRTSGWWSAKGKEKAE